MMPDLGSLPALITAIAAVIGALAALNSALNARRARKAAERGAAGIIEVDGKVYQLDKRVDGRLTDLLETTRRLARSEGVAEGEQAQRDRSATADR